MLVQKRHADSVSLTTRSDASSMACGLPAQLRVYYNKYIDIRAYIMSPISRHLICQSSVNTTQTPAPPHGKERGGENTVNNGFRYRDASHFSIPLSRSSWRLTPPSLLDIRVSKLIFEPP
jgi:hypothetical protein